MARTLKAKILMTRILMINCQNTDDLILMARTLKARTMRARTLRVIDWLAMIFDWLVKIG